MVNVCGCALHCFRWHTFKWYIFTFSCMKVKLLCVRCGDCSRFEKKRPRKWLTMTIFAQRAKLERKIRNFFSEIPSKQQNADKQNVLVQPMWTIESYESKRVNQMLHNLNHSEGTLLYGGPSYVLSLGDPQFRYHCLGLLKIFSSSTPQLKWPVSCDWVNNHRGCNVGASGVCIS